MRDDHDDPICCNRRFVLEKGDTKCCSSSTGGEVYNPNTHVCCNGGIHDRESGECCALGTGSQAWANTSTHTCCPILYSFDSTLVEGTGQCCGNDKVYDGKREQCCEHWDTMTSEMTSKVTSFDERTVELGHQQHFDCCGLHSYNMLNEACCDGVIFPRAPFHKCCENRYVNVLTDICCEVTSGYTTTYKYSPRESGKTKCCGGTPYSPTLKTCHGGNIEDKLIGHSQSCSNIGVYDPTTSSCCSVYPNSQINTEKPSVPQIKDCCAGEAYFKSDQTCCNNELHNRTAGQICCGTDGLINSDTHLCCGGSTAILKPSPFHDCCGSVMYDSTNQICCLGEVFTVTTGGLKCCPHAGAYDPTTQTCCQGNIWPLQDITGGIHEGQNLNGRCCGEQLLTDNQLCVKEARFTLIVNKKEPDHDSVCYGGEKFSKTPEQSLFQTFNSAKKACADNGVLTSLYPNEDQCGGRIYDITNQICCGGVTYAMDLHGAQQQCCPNNATNRYNPETQICDGNTVIDLEPGLKQCGTSNYDPDTQVCRNGQCVRSKERAEKYTEFCWDDGNQCTNEQYYYDPSEKQCCGETQLYGPGEICCNNIVLSIPGPEQGQGHCCGKIAYNDHTHMCCDGTLHNITNNKGAECCGNQIFNPNDSSVICCNEENLWATDGADMVCSGKVAHRPLQVEQTLCGKLVINITTHLCCKHNIYPRSEEGLECCGDVPYNPSDPTQLCCENKQRHLNAEGKQCCHLTAIDINTSTCCAQGGKEYSYSKADAATYCCTEGSYDKAQHTCCQGVLHHDIVNGQCCGMDVVRDSSLEICCGGIVHTEMPYDNSICCGGVFQNGDDYTCCGDVRMYRDQSHSSCCGGVIYSTSQSICENGTLVSLLTTTQPTSASVTTNTSLFTGFVPLPITVTTCGGTPYNQTESTCCNDKILPRFTGFRNCCGDAIYDTRNQTCLNGRIRRIRKGMPCGIHGEGQITNTFVCCNNSFHRIRNGRNQCCGSNTFNPSNHSCCGGVVINSKCSKCCEGKRYHVGKEVCCQGVLFDLAELKGHDTKHCCPAGRFLHLKSGRCFRKECKTCDKTHSKRFWKKKICEKRYLLSATITSFKRKESRFILEASRITELDRNTEQWRDEMKDIRVVIDRGCKCQWITRLLDKMKRNGQEKKEFLIMTDEAIINDKRLVLSSDDYIMEADTERQGKAFMTAFRGCKKYSQVLV